MIAQIREDAIAHLSGPFDTLAVGMEQIPPFLGFGVRNPNLFGGTSQVRFANAHRANLIIVGVSLLEFADVATLQDPRLALDGGQAAHHLETVTGGFQHEEVLGGGVLLGPTLELGRSALC